MLFHESEKMLYDELPSGDKNLNVEMTRGGVRRERRPGQI